MENQTERSPVSTQETVRRVRKAIDLRGEDFVWAARKAEEATRVELVGHYDMPLDLETSHDVWSVPESDEEKEECRLNQIINADFNLALAELCVRTELGTILWLICQPTRYRSVLKLNTATISSASHWVTAK